MSDKNEYKQKYLELRENKSITFIFIFSILFFLIFVATNLVLQIPEYVIAIISSIFMFFLGIYFFYVSYLGYRGEYIETETRTVPRRHYVFNGKKAKRYALFLLCISLVFIIGSIVMFVFSTNQLI